MLSDTLQFVEVAKRVGNSSNARVFSQRFNLFTGTAGVSPASSYTFTHGAIKSDNRREVAFYESGRAEHPSGAAPPGTPHARGASEEVTAKKKRAHTLVRPYSQLQA